MKTTLMTTAIFSMAIAGAAQAATFSTAADFMGGNTVAFTETFSELDDTTMGFTGPLTFGTGITVSSEGNELFSVGTGQSTNTTVALGSNSPDEDTLTIDLGGDWSAFGLDLFQNGGGGSQTGGLVEFTLTTFLDGMLVDTFLTDVAPNGGSFFGFNSIGLFDSVNISGDGMFEVVDNVSAGVSGAAVVPLPASLPLLLAGFGALGVMRRRRKAA